MQPNTDLLDVNPQDALDNYLIDRQQEVSESTLNAHRYRLNHFVRWCNQEGIESLADLSAKHLQDYRLWRQQDGDLNSTSIHTQMTTFRVFLKWAADYEYVPKDFYERVRVPPAGGPRDEKIEPDRAEEIIEYLRTYDYASPTHVMFSLMWHTGLRIGSVRAIDIEDFNETDQYIEIHHRPETDTPLKNKVNGERPVAIDNRRTTLIKDYIETKRHEVTDDHGREPLLTTAQGRPITNTLRAWIYKIARPCEYKHGHCPHGREIDECEATGSKRNAAQCPSSFSPHVIRHSSVTNWLLNDVDRNSLSERVDMTPEVMDKIYDERTEKQKMEQRRDLFKD